MKEKKPHTNETSIKPGQKLAEKDLDWELLDDLIGIFCTGEECSAVLGLHYETINNKIMEKFNVPFPEYFKQKRGKGKASLRRRQFELTKTNPALSIWLGKQYLGQKDRLETSSPENEVLKIKVEIVNENT